MFGSGESHARWETPRGRYDVVQQQVFPQKETKVIEPVGAATLQKVVGGSHGAIQSPTWNLHTTQSKYFAPTKQ